MSDNSNSYTKGMIIGTIIGAAVGSITALLLAPKSGREFRQDIAKRSEEIYDKASDYFSTVEENVGAAISSTINEGKVKAQHIINSARRQAEDLLQNAEVILNDARMKASSAKETIQNKIENLRDAAKASADAFKTEMNTNAEQQ